jgi:hypothetical protein
MALLLTACKAQVVSGETGQVFFTHLTAQKV